MCLHLTLLLASRLPPAAPQLTDRKWCSGSRNCTCPALAVSTPASPGTPSLPHHVPHTVDYGELRLALGQAYSRQRMGITDTCPVPHFTKGCSETTWGRSISPIPEVVHFTIHAAMSLRSQLNGTHGCFFLVAFKSRVFTSAYCTMCSEVVGCRS